MEVVRRDQGDGASLLNVRVFCGYTEWLSNARINVKEENSLLVDLRVPGNLLAQPDTKLDLDGRTELGDVNLALTQTEVSHAT